MHERVKYTPVRDDTMISYTMNVPVSDNLARFVDIDYHHNDAENNSCYMGLL